ncbi:MAG: taurine dioxygenase [Rhodospirillaceae bacterium]|jgi:taurine dioxygenase|nr:taurine dioxygenase [Rhodospirillaceae bacterium]MBT3885322.1 taurine dioxygenase [Rhodospirillaceae bacterium]MBT4118495.1 taurine dioxygenase [Rhodospirillaceae bacterium]MBT4671957.1 taurine dioxygenase [Rhodospirillaceae bacterium]MBT4720938.1 taurine dioxygenase [Rhodospirillaceae bacterium]
MADYSKIQVTPYASALGAVIGGVDLASVDDDTYLEVRRALMEHQVIFFEDQHMTPEQHLAFGRRFGSLNIHDFVGGMEEHPEIVEVRKEPEDERNFGGAWHVDVIYLEEPPLGSILYAKEIPGIGGDTLFANQVAAYDALSKGMKDMLDGMTAIATPALIYGTQSTDWSKTSSMNSSPTATAEGEVEHPVVRVHPETGRKSLFLSGKFTPRFKDMTMEESAPLMDYLFAHQTKPQFCCRFKWAENAVAFWDNRCVMHYALNDYPGQRRLMHRVAVNGDRPH